MKFINIILKVQFVPRRKHCVPATNVEILKMHRQIIIVCSENRWKHKGPLLA